MDYYLKALSINEDLNDHEGIAINNVNIGIIYFQQGDYNKALNYYTRALTLNENSKNRKELAANLVDIGTLYSTKAEYPKAMEYYQRALVIDEQQNNKDGKAVIFSNLGQDYYDQGNYAEALKYYFMSLALYKDLGSKDGIAASYGAIGSAYLAVAKNFDEGTTPGGLIAASKAANLDKATEFLNKALIICREIGNLSYQIPITHDISEAYSLAGKCSEALQSLKLYTTLKDSVFSDQNKIKINDLEKKREKELNSKLARLEALKKRNEGAVTLAAFIVLIAIIAIVIRNNRRVNKEKRRSDELLLNILPEKVAHELKTTGKSGARLFDPVTVIFTDFVDFTIAAERMTPHELISELDLCFRAFDGIIGKHGIEKIKTAGDAYMAVAGLPEMNPKHAENMVNAALEINQFMQERRKELGSRTFDIRLGIHSGTVVAGIVGIKKFAYDIWGDTVNIAARMEQHSKTGRINISETTYELVKDKFDCTYRGEIEAKNKGNLKMYFVNGPKQQ